jgi:hypothetical protein
LRAETASGHECAFAVTTVDGDTGDTLQGFSKVGVREFTDVLGADGIDDADCIALDFHRLLQRAAQTGNDDFFQFFRCTFLRIHRIDQDRATNDGEQGLPIEFRFHRVSSPQHCRFVLIFFLYSGTKLPGDAPKPLRR